MQLVCKTTIYCKTINRTATFIMVAKNNSYCKLIFLSVKRYLGIVTVGAENSVKKMLNKNKI